MLEAAALALAVTAVALSFAVDGARGAPRWVLLRRPGRARWLGRALGAAALAVWNAAEPGPAAFLAVPLALLAAGTVLALGAPLLRRRARPAAALQASAHGAPAPHAPPAVATPASTPVANARTAPGSAAPQSADAHRRERRGRTRAAPDAARTLRASLLVLGITLGTLPVALLASAAAARFSPFSEDARYALGFALVIPLWQLCMCLALLARRGSTLLGACAALGLALAALVFGVGR